MIENAAARPHVRFAALVRDHLKPPFNFVRHDIAYREAIGPRVRGAGVGDVVDEVRARAASERSSQTG